MVVTLAIVAIGYIAIYSNSSPTADLPTTTSVDTDTETEKVRMEETKYLQYKEGQLSEYSDKRIVLFFYANWCPTCRPVDQEIQERQQELPEDVVVIRVNYNDSETNTDEKNLAEAYDITYQHTFVILDNQQEISKWNGGNFDRVITELN